jgi:xanthine dehydrogenase accessory factor
VPDLSSTDIGERTLVVVATQGHGDEEALELVVSARPAFVGLVASRKRGVALPEYLSGRGVPQGALEHVHTPVGIDLGHTSHREIAVAILAELVQLRAAGAFTLSSAARSGATAAPATSQAIDPVCAMTVTVDESGWSPYTHEHDGTTYRFCCVGCRNMFAADPRAYLSDQEQEV